MLKHFPMIVYQKTYVWVFVNYHTTDSCMSNATNKKLW